MADYAYGSSKRRWDAQTWSWTLGRFADIRVRVHALFLVFIASRLLFGLSDLGFEVAMLTTLFILVLLHEFGHCFGCRWVGGQADDILLWPLGGLAYANPPQRPYENLVTVAAGPAVNAAILVLLVPVLYLLGALSLKQFNPFDVTITEFGLAGYAALAFKLNLILLLFNLMPFYPFDGGRLLQIALWYRLSHFHATMIATTVGMGGALLLTVLGIYLAGAWSSGYLLLAMIGLYGFYTCLTTRRQLELMGQMPDNEFGYDFSEGYTSLERSMSKTRRRGAGPGLRRRFQAWLDRRRKRQAALVEAQLDRILEKIHSSGMQSLSREERRVLAQASKHRRARD